MHKRLASHGSIWS